jgi:prepilin-type N-terminal cleavage/methylation domain-containing protein
MQEARTANRRGFTLLEILLVIGIMGVIAIFTIGISHSIRNMTKVNDTRGRMEQIAAKAREFYRTHQQLPFPVTTPPLSVNLTPGDTMSLFGQVPVSSGTLNLEQKFRLDAWGQYFQYALAYVGPITVDGINVTIGGGLTDYPGYTLVGLNTDIDGLRFNGATGQRVAAVLISFGPNQTQNFSTSGNNPSVYTLDAGSDDIVVPINVSQEAIEIATEQLKTFQAKVKAFDAVYEGIDNNGDGTVDEDPNGSGVAPDQCFRQESTTCCPPTPDPTPANRNDPNCGTVTLDNVKNGYYTSAACPFNGGVASTDRARHFICQLYSLADSYRIDPWLNGYTWGCNSTVCSGGYTSSNPRYHKFFSTGPNGTAGDADDIIP